MQRNLRKIITFYLLIVGLVIFSHSIIPHDHHYDIIEGTEHHEKHNSTGQEPIHCHFFNDVIINKISTSTQKVVKQISSIYENEIIPFFEFDRNTILKAIFYIDFYYPDYIAFLENSPTRGSPSK